MLRIKDPGQSLKFYQEVMGMSLLRAVQSAAGGGFTLYFLGYPGPEIGKRFPPDTQSAQLEGLLELTWNHGTETDDEFSYHDGNKEPQGFGHICKCWLCAAGQKSNMLTAYTIHCCAARHLGRRHRCGVPAVRETRL